MLNHNLVLKSGEFFTAGDLDTDGSRERATGLYYRDTRHLSGYQLTLDGSRPETLSVSADTMDHATIVATNRHLVREEEVLHAQKLLVTQEMHLADVLTVDITVANFDLKTVTVALEVLLASDFRDIFDIRGFPRSRRGTLLPPAIGEDTADLRYAGLDGQIAATRIAWTGNLVAGSRTVATGADPAEVIGSTHSGNLIHSGLPAQLPALCLGGALRLASQERVTLTLTITPIAAGDAEGRAPATFAALPESATVMTDNPRFTAVIAQSISDLAALETPFQHGPLLAAGIPWFVSPFGRDSLIAALQTLHLSPERAAATVRTLAALQGTEVNPDREEEPGKILHEMRYGEMARLREVPHSPYYGSVDATPLWLWLLAETVRWTGDRALLDDLRPNVDAALAWIDQYGDRDGDGLVEYRTDAAGAGHITHQVWKDSFDSLHHADGSSPSGPVAAVEVQGYVYAALSRLAGITSDEPWAADLRARAEALRKQIEARFWSEEFGRYAQALDGEKRPVVAANSNGGHLLACALPSPARAARLADGLTGPDMLTGWGVRTLGSSAPSFNPMSYHNGSIWPHDNSLIGFGMYRNGLADAGHVIATALFDAALTMELGRLPELYCGFPRETIAGSAPIPYPVSCSPQAWAAGALPLLVRGMLGLEPDPTTGRLIVKPNLPSWLDQVTLTNIRSLGHTGSITVTRSGAGYQVISEGLPVETARAGE